MKMDDTKEGELIFPAPPSHPKELQFELNNTVFVRARSWSRTSSNTRVCYLGSFGPSNSPQYYDQVDVQPLEKVWLPSQDPHDEKKHKGQWKQEVTFKSVMRMTCPPSFQTDTMALRVRRPA